MCVFISFLGECAMLLTNWTSREKKLLSIICVLSLVTVSLMFSQWIHNDAQDQGSDEQSASGEGLLMLSTGEENGGESKGASNEEDSKNNAEAIGQDEQVELESIIVDVKGAVQQPGVYPLKEGQRIHEAIAEAGGLREDASTQTINLAQVLTDGMAIHIPTFDEIEMGDSASIDFASGYAHVEEERKININNATVEDLQRLSGIGLTRAQAIIQYRDEHQRFTNIEEIRSVSGIGEKTFETIKDDIAVQ